jgi:peptide/nickel transport system permease protein
MLLWGARRAAAGILLVWLVATVAFALVSLAPGDAASRLYDTRLPPSARERLRSDFGLDRPWTERYASWLGGAVTGDLGTSWLYHRSVAGVIAETLPNTLLLAGLGLAVELLGGVAIALVQLRRPHGIGDRIITAATLTAYALPTFIVGLGLLTLLAFRVHLFPPSHMFSPSGELATGPRRVLDLLQHLVLPVAAIGITGVGAVARYLRGSLLDERASTYVLAARARGCSRRRAIYAHALPNALLPLITMIGLSLPFLVSGSLIVEVVFAWPGMGRLMYSAALARDVPLLLGGTILATVAVVAGNFVADIAYAAVDPRVRT